MIQIDRTGNNYAENVIDQLLTFEDVQTWTVASGTGSSARSNNYAFEGQWSLRINNDAPTTDIVVTNSVQSTFPIQKLTDYDFSFYVRKEAPSDAYSGNVKIYKNAILLDTQTWSLEDTQDGQWYRFVTDQTYSLAFTDEMTFTFQFDGDAGFVGTKIIYIDGICLAPKERVDVAPAVYTPPRPTLQTVTRGGAETTDNVSFGEVTAAQFKLSALNTAPASAVDTGTEGDVRIDADYIYVCTATDTWKRVAIATW